jgi:hypothetical protein
MRHHTRLVALLAVGAFAAAACESPQPRGTERWTATANTNVPIDWDKVQAAYQKAEGPQDFEQKVNELYEGEELISVHVQDVDDKTQVVTGFFDRNGSGAVDEPEKIFTVTRTITADGAGTLQTAGYGPYYGYTSPLLSIATGMLMGSMLASAFSPRYVPMYVQPYATNQARRGELMDQRSSYRASNPSRYGSPVRSTTTTRSYGGSRTSGSRGGGRFGLARAGRRVRPARLTA